ncbi:MAG: hypothetical protein ABI769_07845 [Pseudomonadota bacterium]
MNARELDPRTARAATRAARLAGLWLSMLVLLGLWQGYGAWLFAEGGAHVQ